MTYYTIENGENIQSFQISYSKGWIPCKQIKLIPIWSIEQKLYALLFYSNWNMMWTFDNRIIVSYLFISWEKHVVWIDDCIDKLLPPMSRESNCLVLHRTSFKWTVGCAQVRIDTERVQRERTRKKVDCIKFPAGWIVDSRLLVSRSIAALSLYYSAALCCE